MHPRVLSPSLRRLALAALVFVLPTGCDKGGGKTNEPGGGAAGGGNEQADKSSESPYTYADNFALDGQISVDFSNESPEGKGAAKIVAQTRIEAVPVNGKTKIHGKVTDLVEYTGTGSLDAEFMKQQMAKNGKTDFDLIAALESSEDWLVVDQYGELDEAASKALAENAAKEEGMGAADFGLFNLPDLPKVALELGKPTPLPTEEKDENMFGQVIPMEIDRTWTLVSVGEKDGRKVAKFDVTSESSGAAELEGQGGGGMLAIGQESHFVMEFDVDAKIPISLSGDSAFELSFEGGGQSVNFQNQSKIDARYAPATAPAAAPAAAPTTAPATAG